jgi:hypothetical protein
MGKVSQKLFIGLGKIGLALFTILPALLIHFPNLNADHAGVVIPMRGHRRFKFHNTLHWKIPKHVGVSHRTHDPGPAA